MLLTDPRLKARQLFISFGGDALILLDKVLETCLINDSSPSAHALFVALRMVWILLADRCERKRLG